MYAKKQVTHIDNCDLFSYNRISQYLLFIFFLVVLDKDENTTQLKLL